VLEGGQIVTEARSDRRQRRLVRGSFQQRGHEPRAPGVAFRQQHRFFVGEVTEEGAGRDVAGLDDLLDRGPVEPVPGEQVEGRVLESFPRLELLPFPETDIVHGAMMTGTASWRKQSNDSL